MASMASGSANQPALGCGQALTKTSVEYLTSSVMAMSETDVRIITNDWINAQGGPAEQLSGLRELFQVAGENSEIMNEVVSEGWAVLLSKEIWKAKYSSQAEALDAIDTPLLKDLRQKAFSNRKRKGKSIDEIRKNWPDATNDWEIDRLGETCLGALASISKRYSPEEATTMIIQVAIARLQEVKVGRGSTRQVIISDWQDLDKMSEESALALLKKAIPSGKKLMELQLDLLTLTYPKRGITGVNSSSRKRRQYGHRRSEKRMDVEGGLDIEEGVDSEGNMDIDPPEVIGAGDGSEEEQSSGSDSERSELGEEETIISPEVAESRGLALNCKCTGIPVAILDRVCRKSTISAGMNNAAECIDTLRVFIKPSKRGTGLEHVCHRHLLRLGGHFGLQVKSLNTGKLRSRLQACWDHRVDLIAFKSSPETVLWWRLNARPRTEDDDHGVYTKRPLRSSLLRPLTAGRVEAIVNEIAGPAAWATWTETGNLIIRGMFRWLWDGVSVGGTYEQGVGDHIIEEFNLYMHHQRERNGQPNKGWLRTMFYSLTQQIIRQDLEYWALYACLRPDRNVRLVSYPYYTKFAQPGDATFFRHIDMNVPKYLENGHGANIIQGSVSLDDEGVNGCTELVPGFHKHIGEWWGKVVSRGRATDGHVHGLEKLWLPEDTGLYGGFIPFPCQQGDVRVTRPEIPHGSTPDLGGGVRKTVLPWFVGVGEDGETLDNVESDKWSDLAVAHARQTAVLLTPSGLSNRFGPIRYKFPPSTQLLLTSPVSQALVCRSSWDDPVVQAQANILLSADRAAARAEIESHRLEALRAFRQAFQRVKQAERIYYGAGSFSAGRDH